MEGIAEHSMMDLVRYLFLSVGPTILFSALGVFWVWIIVKIAKRIAAANAKADKEAVRLKAERQRRKEARLNKLSKEL